MTDKQPIDDATNDILDAIEKASHALTYRGRWSNKDTHRIKQAIRYLMQVTDEIENIQIGPEPASTWKPQAEKDDLDIPAFLRPQAE